MYQVYNPETALIEEIERMELEARDVRRKLQKSQNVADTRVLNKQLTELEEHVRNLQGRLPH